MSLLNKTYEIVTPPEAAMHWDEYERLLWNEWEKLLNSGSQNDEKIFHQFFETHPCLMPSVYGVFGRGGHGAWPTALISKPVLPSFTRKIPDFMWIVSDSSAVYAVLIEIEAPEKKWFTQKGKQSEKLTQSIDQIKEWKAWFSNPLNIEQFKSYYSIPNELLNYRSFFQRYVVIYGRREEAMQNKEFSKKRAHLQGNDEIFMSYDRLTPLKDLSNYLCVNIRADGYHAISVPPTLRFTPFHAPDWAMIQDKIEAVSNNKYLTKKRKNFLMKRWSYWDEWGRTNNKGTISSGDFE